MAPPDQAAIDAAIDQLTGDAIPEPSGPADPGNLNSAIHAVARRKRLSGDSLSRLQELLGDNTSTNQKGATSS